MRYTGLFISLSSYFLILEFWAAAHAPLPHVLHYEVVQLQALQRRTKRSDSPQQKYPDTLEYRFPLGGKNVTVYLEKNRELLGKNYSLTHYTEDGPKEIVYSSYKDHCYYQGHIRNIKDSSVSVGLCSGMQGFFRAENQVYLIEPLEDSVKGDHAVYKQEHMRTKRTAVRYINDTVYNQGPRVAGLHKSRKMGLMGTQRFVEMVLVVDHKEYTKFGSLKSVEKRMLEVANHVDKLYRPLNIRVMLMGLEVWSYQDHITVSHMPNLTLDRFLKWRQTNLLPRKKHDNAQFVTAVNFEGSTVGLAPLYSMCTSSSGAVNEDHTNSPLGVASTIAHEMGHNLGMSHDDSIHCVCSETSSDQSCVMGDSIGYVLPEAFSSCSKAALEKFLQNYDSRCLLDVPNVDELYGGPECGNGFVEKGEECDCGTLEECQDPCCNATTCRLTEGSQCAHGECCNNCQLKQVGSLCRPRAHDCDLEEYCTGMSAHCPKDDYKMNGVPCNSHQGYCYKGQCPTHKEHCKMLWGQDADVDYACFNNNGVNCKRPGFRRCSHLDYKCGKIYCSGGNAYPITNEVGRVYMNNRMCKLAVDNSGTEDIGMVPTGTKCGTNKVCYNSLCQDIDGYETKNCSAKCNNHGVCNHEKQCQCDPGWAQPYCDVKLFDLPSSKDDVYIGMIAAIVILVLITLITGPCVCYRKRRTIRKNRYFKNVNTYPGQCNAGFQPGSVKNRPNCGPPRISQPVFLESSTTQDCRPLFASVAPRQAPQIVKLSSIPPVMSNNIIFSETKPFLRSTPLPPSRPLPPLMNKPVNKPKPHPVPPVKPSGINPMLNSPQVSAVQKVPLKPPPKYR